jgi:photoactive yellow protein
MSSPSASLAFDQPALAQAIDSLSAAQLDDLGFGVIGFDDAGIVCLYNRFESKAAALLPENVVGLPVFINVAPCMNNFMVAQRFEDAKEAGADLDATVDFVLTWRMRPTDVKLRLLAGPGLRYRYVLINRLSSPAGR